MIAYHLKDGDRNQTWAGPPAGGPYIQNKARPGTILRSPTGSRRARARSASGHPGDAKWQASAGFGEFIQRPAGRYQRLHIIESDGAVGGAAGSGALAAARQDQRRDHDRR